jgi:ABC-2 type transport system ATP-binding protein
VTFGNTQAVRDISLSVTEGEIVVILGHNGAGKTTTTETILGFRRPTSGSVSVMGADPYAEHNAVTSRVGALLQRGGVWAPMNPREVLALTATYYENPRSSSELIELLGLSKSQHTPWRRLSGGEQQRTLLALALIGRPDLLVLDEPTAAVDPEGHHLIRDLLRAERERGVGLVVTTHELNDAEALADRIIIINHGEIAAQGSLDELRNKPLSVVELSREIESTEFASALGYPVSRDGASYRIDGVVLSAAVLEEAAQKCGVTVRGLRTRATLEERYLDIVGGAQ